MAKKIVTSKKNQVNDRAYHKRLIVLVVAFPVFLFLVYQLSPLTGNVDFYSKWAECGQKPVRVKQSQVSWHEAPPAIELTRFGTYQYYCTALDAERAGVSATPDRYDFPLLKQ